MLRSHCQQRMNKSWMKCNIHVFENHRQECNHVYIVEELLIQKGEQAQKGPRERDANYSPVCVPTLQFKEKFRCKFLACL